MNLNRRVPNGLPGGVRGRKFYYFLLLDYYETRKKSILVNIELYNVDEQIKNHFY